MLVRRGGADNITRRFISRQIWIIILLYFHMLHPIFFSLLLLLLGTGSSALVNGCIKYTVDGNKQLKCIYCFYNMGLTQSGTCELCKSGYAVTQGTCQPKATTVSQGQATGFTQIETKPTLVLPSVVSVPSTISNINIQSAQSNYFFTLNNNKKSTTNTAGSQDSPSSSFVSFGQVTAPQPPSGQVIKQTLPNCDVVGSNGDCEKCRDKFVLNMNKQCEEVKVVVEPSRANCFIYSSMTSKCLQCKSNYVLTQQGLCIQGKVAETKLVVNPQEFNPIQSNTAQITFDSSQSFKPLGKYTSAQANYDQNQGNPLNSNVQAGYDASQGSFGSQNVDNDFGYFGVENTQSINNKSENTQSQNQPATASNADLNDKTPQTKMPQKAVVHKYPQFPYCFDFFGDSCWACVPGYLLNLIINQCVPYVKPITNITKPVDKTSSDQAQAPTTPQSNCNVFSQNKGVCEECYRNYYFNKEKKSCLAVDQLCRTYDEDTGVCKSCYTNYSLSSEGKCLKNE